jgi:hypothetical protein
MVGTGQYISSTNRYYTARYFGVSKSVCVCVRVRVFNSSSAHEIRPLDALFVPHNCIHLIVSVKVAQVFFCFR